MTVLFAALPAIAAMFPGAVGIALIQRWDRNTTRSTQAS